MNASGAMNVIAIDTPWSRATISLFGAQVLSFVPAGEEDLLWMSPAPLPPPAAIRGGVPLCWPWFARQNVPATAVQHGPARISEWRVVSQRLNGGGEPELMMRPVEPLDPMSVELMITVGRSLRISLTTVNEDRVPRTLTQALHTYLRVTDAERAVVAGLDGLPYIDSRQGGAPARQQGDIDPPVALDRIYHGFAGDPAVSVVDRDARRTLTVSAEGSRSVVVWNPGEALAAGMKDVPGDSWRGFVCVEAANAGPDRRELAPGQSHRLTQTLSVRRH
ncbi:MAG TPA: D-hexose-6-phosphate mutarotase [Burkholderiaceae bacterium]|nr:D-hexose-6-phosphate mutarotase [Burkholderiaceae bacterium]